MSLLRTRIWQSLHVTPRGAIEAFLIALGLVVAEPTLTSLLVGGATAIVGECIRLWAAGYAPGTLRLGPFRWVRHPHIFGSVLLFTGMALATANIYTMILTVLLLPLAYRGRFLRAEADTQRRLGPWYVTQRDSVPSLMPRLWPAGTALNMGQVQINNLPNSKGFSFERGLLRGRHRELDTLVAMTVVGTLLYLISRSHEAQALHWWMLAGLALTAAVRVVYYRLR